MVSVDLRYLEGFVDGKEFDNIAPMAETAHRLLFSGEGAGSDFTGWVGLPEKFDRDEFARVKMAASRIRENSDVLVVIGIGGSYLGARAAIELLTSPFYNLMKKDGPEIYFAGCNISSDYLCEILDLCEGKRVSVNVISKSGTTTEPALAFRVFREFMERKYGREGSRERIYCTTDGRRGTLKSLADAEGWETFVVPDDIGGRFSVLTPVGMLPVAAAGIDVDAIMAGAANEMRRCACEKLADIPACEYAAARRILAAKGKAIELLVSYEPAFAQMAEWWKQLFGESEGKDQKGIYPASAIFSMDLHSLGQFVQDGSRNIFETVVNFKKARREFFLDPDRDNLDGLHFLSGQNMSAVNEMARLGTVLAHTGGGIPNIVVEVPERTPYEFGSLVYFFEMAVALSGYMSGVNPFDQPGVESYKKNMFALLGKPGYEELKGRLEAKLGTCGR